MFSDCINLQETPANPLAHLFHSTAHLFSSHSLLQVSPWKIKGLLITGTALKPWENLQDEAIA